MHHCTTTPRARRTAVRLAPLAAATLASAVFAGPALAQGPQISVSAIRDSVIATGLPLGQTSVSVFRPDAITGNPVTIGQYTDFANPNLPFSVNTTTPTALNPGGDCWQDGALALPGGLGLTPDIRSGDTVAVSGGGPSTTVPAGSDAGDGPTGPIAGCAPLSSFGVNAVTGASGDKSDVAISGTAQPLATGVTLAATDGTASTDRVDATFNADGTWKAALPASGLSKLADGDVTLDAIYAVPDVATGAAAHIRGVPLAVKKGPGGAIVSPNPAAPGPGAPGAPSSDRLTTVSATRKVRLAHARRGGIRVAWYVPTGAKVMRLRLAYRGRHTRYLQLLDAAPAGTRQAVRLTGFKGKLRRGRYTLTVMAGPSRTDLGPAVRRSLTIR